MDRAPGLSVRLKRVPKRSPTPGCWGEFARSPQRAQPPILEHGDLPLDPCRRLATPAGGHRPPNPMVFEVLERLLAAWGRVVFAEELLERSWP